MQARWFLIVALAFLSGCAALHADRSDAPPEPGHRAAPPTPNDRGEYEAVAKTFRAVFTTTPRLIPYNEYFEMVVRLETPDEPSLDGAALTIGAEMPENHSHMATQPQVTRAADGTYRVRGMLLHMPGYWEIYFDLKHGGHAERAHYGFELE